jgi:hypothetical protein
MKTFSIGLFLTLYSTVSTSKYEITRVTKTNALRLCFSGSSLKHQYTGRYIVPLKHTILIPSQPVFFSPYCCIHIGEIKPGLKRTSFLIVQNVDCDTGLHLNGDNTICLAP